MKINNNLSLTEQPKAASTIWIEACARNTGIALKSEKNA